jgi:hypothetical protein
MDRRISRRHSRISQTNRGVLPNALREESISFDYDLIDGVSAVDIDHIRAVEKRNAMRGARRVLSAALLGCYQESKLGRFVALQWLVVTDDPCLLGANLETMARQFDRDRAALSKGCRDICEKNSLPPSQYMRSLEAVKSYGIRQRSKVKQQAKS